MNVQESYNIWAKTYDSMPNKTRDIEGRALRILMANIEVENALEIGCGTGKNTLWLQNKAKHLVAADFSQEMLNISREKITSEYVIFKQMDLLVTWDFPANSFDLIICSLTLEHIENLEAIFRKAAMVMRPDSLFYIGELHPMKQYQGSKARFETENGTIVLDCFVHHVSDFYSAAQKNGLQCVELQEWFDEDDRKSEVPRLLTMVFKKT
jgi:ubiquinone/menaquinone biosynthesis C-methylase UbiE